MVDTVVKNINPSQNSSLQNQVFKPAENLSNDDKGIAGVSNNRRMVKPTSQNLLNIESQVFNLPKEINQNNLEVSNLENRYPGVSGDQEQNVKNLNTFNMQNSTITKVETNYQVHKHNTNVKNSTYIQPYVPHQRSVSENVRPLGFTFYDFSSSQQKPIVTSSRVDPRHYEVLRSSGVYNKANSRVIKVGYPSLRSVSVGGYSYSPNYSYLNNTAVKRVPLTNINLEENFNQSNTLNYKNLAYNQVRYPSERISEINMAPRRLSPNLTIYRANIVSQSREGSVRRSDNYKSPFSQNAHIQSQVKANQFQKITNKSQVKQSIAEEVEEELLRKSATISDTKLFPNLTSRRIDITPGISLKSSANQEELVNPNTSPSLDLNFRANGQYPEIQRNSYFGYAKSKNNTQEITIGSQNDDQDLLITIDTKIHRQMIDVQDEISPIPFIYKSNVSKAESKADPTNDRLSYLEELQQYSVKSQAQQYVRNSLVYDDSLQIGPEIRANQYMNDIKSNRNSVYQNPSNNGALVLQENITEFNMFNNYLGSNKPLSQQRNLEDEIENSENRRQLSRANFSNLDGIKSKMGARRLFEIVRFSQNNSQNTSLKEGPVELKYNTYDARGGANLVSNRLSETDSESGISARINNNLAYYNSQRNSLQTSQPKNAQPISIEHRVHQQGNSTEKNNNNNKNNLRNAIFTHLTTHQNPNQLVQYAMGKENTSHALNVETEQNQFQSSQKDDRLWFRNNSFNEEDSRKVNTEHNSKRKEKATSRKIKKWQNKFEQMDDEPQRIDRSKSGRPRGKIQAHTLRYGVDGSFTNRAFR